MNSDDIIELDTFSTDAVRRFLVSNRSALNKLPQSGTPHSGVLPDLVVAEGPPTVRPLKDGTMLVTVRYVRKENAK